VYKTSLADYDARTGVRAHVMLSDQLYCQASSVKQMVAGPAASW